MFSNIWRSFLLSLVTFVDLYWVKCTLKMLDDCSFSNTISLAIFEVEGFLFLAERSILTKLGRQVFEVDYFSVEVRYCRLLESAENEPESLHSLTSSLRFLWLQIASNCFQTLWIYRRLVAKSFFRWGEAWHWVLIKVWLNFGQTSSLVKLWSKLTSFGVKLKFLQFFCANN